MPGLIYKPFKKDNKEGPTPLKKLRTMLTEDNIGQIKRDLDATFKLIGEEFKSIKTCKLYAFFKGLDAKDQDKIINFLKGILKDED